MFNMKKDSKHICKNMEITGTVIRNTNKGLRINNNYHCIIKNISLNNVLCGICNTFRNINEPDTEQTEVTEYKPELSVAQL